MDDVKILLVAQAINCLLIGISGLLSNRPRRQKGERHSPVPESDVHIPPPPKSSKACRKK